MTDAPLLIDRLGTESVETVNRFYFFAKHQGNQENELLCCFAIEYRKFRNGAPPKVRLTVNALDLSIGVLQYREYPAVNRDTFPFRWAIEYALMEGRIAKDWNIERTGYIEQLISSDFRDEELNNIDQSCAETYAPRVLELYGEVIALADEWIVNEAIKCSQAP
ncbi:MAG: hypothetical protein SOR95_08240 [Sutterella sp.]|nr:hypothetical protein [Sutterella sp.]